MILAYVTICLMELHTCAPEVAVAAQPFDTEMECWASVDKFMERFSAVGSPVTLRWTCGEES